MQRIEVKGFFLLLLPLIWKYLKGTQFFLSCSLFTGSETEIHQTESESLCQLEIGASNTVTIIR